MDLYCELPRLVRCHQVRLIDRPWPAGFVPWPSGMDVRDGSIGYLLDEDRIFETVHDGDWIVTSEDGVSVCRAADFERRYKRALGTSIVTFHEASQMMAGVPQCDCPRGSEHKCCG